MEKKNYKRPIMQLEEFIPNECVATCGSEKYYDFTCDAEAGVICYYPDFPASGPRPTPEQIKAGVRITDRNSDYHPCQEGRHDVPASELSQFYHGFVDRSHGNWWDWDYEARNHKEDEGEGAIIWIQNLGYGRTSGHATTALSMSEIPLVKS